jgi:hypothetical protein
VAPFQWGSEGGAMTLQFDSTRAEEGGSQRRTSRRRRPQAAKALPNEGGRQSPRWAILGWSGHADRATARLEWVEWADAGREQRRGERTKLQFRPKSLTGCRNSFKNKSKF